MKILALFLLLLAACTPAGEPTAAPSPGAIPTPTSTPPPPLTAHEWIQSEPLITYGNLCGLCGGPFAETYPMEFTLLPSGDLYLRKSIENSGAEVILTTRLSRQATCYLLNSIDQAGFFDYDPSSCEDPSNYLTAYPDSLGPGQSLMVGPTDAGGTCISVRAWRSNTACLYGLTMAFWQERQNQLRGIPAPVFPNILPAIRVTFQLLENYQPSGTLHVLRPGRLGVWLYGSPRPLVSIDFVEWPLKSHTLAAGVPPGGYLQPHPDMILTGKEASQVYEALGETLQVYGALNVREGDKLYTVFARPLLPNEFTWSPLPLVSLSCSPSDGWMQAP